MEIEIKLSDCKHYQYDPRSGWDTCDVAEQQLYFNCYGCEKYEKKVLVKVDHQRAKELLSDVKKVFDDNKEVMIMERGPEYLVSCDEMAKTRIPKYSEYEWQLKEAAQYNLGYCEGMEKALELIFGGGEDE